MVTSEERMRILQMIQDGKIGVDDGAKLLSAMEDQDRPARRPRLTTSWQDARMLRVRVADQSGEKAKVSVTLPIALVDAGLNIAANYVTDMDDARIESLKDAIRSGYVGKILDYVDEKDGEYVQVYIE